MRPRRASCIALLALAAAGPAAADWLVLRDGSRLETRGSWRTDGRRVVFTHANGSLASLPLDEVDLAASETANTEAAAVETETHIAPVTRPPVLVLTDDDVSRVYPLAASEEEGSATAAAPGETSSNPLEVTGWRDEYNADISALEVFGSLKNQTKGLVGSIALTVHLLDQDGKELAEQVASVAIRALPAGKTTSFRAAFPGITNFRGIRFDISSDKVTFSDPRLKEEAEEKEPDGTEEVPVPASN